MTETSIIKFNTLEELSKLLHISSESLEELKFDYNYKHFKIEKKKKKTYRFIDAPKFKLKILQKWILVNVLQNVHISDQATAFIKNKNGIKDNAQRHLNNKYLLEMDLKDFYPSISLSKIIELFKSKPFDFNVEMAKYLGYICTCNKKLPQGAVTSPIISNLICSELDENISSYCRKHNITYSRYADDLTFSSNDKVRLNLVKRDIKLFIKQDRFIINDEKTRFLSSNFHQQVTGITINNGELKTNKKLKRKVRALLFFCIKNSSFIDKNGKNRELELLGCISFIKSIEPGYIDICLKYVENLLKKFTKQDELDLIKTLTKMNKKTK